MLCDECGINPATVRFQTLLQGKKTEENLCQTCWQKKNAQILGGISIGDLLAGLIKGAQQEQVPDLHCEQCGQTYAEFKKTGLLGCAQCYAAFGERMEEALLRVHGRAQHAGKVPPDLRESQDRARRVDALKQEMEKAITAEDFERAAELRDEIRALCAEPTAKGGE